MKRWSLGEVCLGIGTSAVYVFLWLPIAVLVAFSFNSSPRTVAWDHASLHWYQVLLSDRILLAAVGRSVWIALLTTLVTVLIGTPAALVLSRERFPGKAACGLLTQLPMFIPDIVIASSLVTFFGICQLTLSMTTVLIAHVAFSLSYLILTVKARLADLDQSVEEASMDLGADEITTFFRITLPMMLPGVISGALMVFTISLDEFVITSFVSGVGCTTLPVQIYSMVKQGVGPEINAVSTLLLLFTVGSLSISQALQRSHRHE